MMLKIDIGEAAERLQAMHARLHHAGKAHHQSIAVVLPLGEGQSEVVRSYLEEGPPFDPRAIGLTSHAVYLTDREVIFVFESDEGVEAFERILGEAEFWEVVSAWEHSTSEEPRLGTPAYEWRDQPSGAQRTP